MKINATLTVYAEGETDGAMICRLLNRAPKLSNSFIQVGSKETGIRQVDCDVYTVVNFEQEVKLIHALALLYPRIKYKFRIDGEDIITPGPLLDRTIYSNYMQGDGWTIKDIVTQAFQEDLNYYSMDIRCMLTAVYHAVARTPYNAIAQEADLLEQTITQAENTVQDDKNPLINFYHWLIGWMEQCKKQFDSENNHLALLVDAAVLKICREHFECNEENYNDR